MRGQNLDYQPEIDHLRLLAATLVLFFHTALFSGSGRAANWFRIPLIDQGHIGVQLFMVISGYLMMTIFSRRELDARKFYANRALRIYPLLILVVSIGYFSTPDPRSTSVGLDYLLALLPISNLYRLDYGPFGGHMWTVAVELQFYLLFPILLAFRRRTTRASFYGGVIAIATLMRMAVYFATGTAHTFTYFTLFGNIDLFVAGMLSAEICSGLKAKHICLHLRWSVLALAATALVVTLAFSHRSFFHVDYFGISANGVSGSALWIVWPSILAVCWSGLLITYLRSPGTLPGSKWLAQFGTWTYSTYVWHVLVIEILKTRFPWMPTYVFAGTVIFPAMLSISWISFNLLEAPFLNLRKNYQAANQSEDQRDDSSAWKAAENSKLGLTSVP